MSNKTNIQDEIVSLSFESLQEGNSQAVEQNNNHRHNTTKRHSGKYISILKLMYVETTWLLCYTVTCSAVNCTVHTPHDVSVYHVIYSNIHISNILSQPTFVIPHCEVCVQLFL